MSKFNQGNTRASKLNGIQVIEIRQKAASRLYTQDDLARQYQVSITTIRNIVNGVTWQNIPGIVPEDVLDLKAKQSELMWKELEKLPEGIETVEMPPDLADKLAADAAAKSADELGLTKKDPLDDYLAKRGSK